MIRTEAASGEENPARISPRRAVLTMVGMAVASGGAVALLSRFDPRTAGFFPPCVFHRLTGLHCPGCGATRALHALVHGDLPGALHDSAMFVLMLPVLVGLLGAEMLLPPGRRPFVPPRAIWAFFVLLVTFTVARNVPVYPFTLLAPR